VNVFVRYLIIYATVVLASNLVRAFLPVFKDAAILIELMAAVVLSVLVFLRTFLRTLRLELRPREIRERPPVEPPSRQELERRVRVTRQVVPAKKKPRPAKKKPAQPEEIVRSKWDRILDDDDVV